MQFGNAPSLLGKLNLLKQTQLLFTTVGLLLANLVSANGFGIFEARGLAMGGTTVALANTDNALFYNPALLSFHNGDEDELRDGSFYMPIIALQASDTVEDAYNIEDDDLPDELSAAIDNFNAAPSPENAQSIVDSSTDLLDALETLGANDITGDGFLGFSLSEPGDRQGAGFYLGGRVIGGGRANITEADSALLEDYIEALEFIASNGADGEAHPELFSGGQLIDPVDVLTSSARVTGAGIVEVGLAFSKELSVWGVPVAFGLTPKWMRIRSYEVVQVASGGSINSTTAEQDFQTANVDMGVAIELAEHYRIGLAVKDVITKQLDTELGNQIRLAAKPRLGLAYVSEQLQMGLDLDLNRVEALGDEAALQELSLGGEWRISRHFSGRIGYRHDIRGEREDIASIGLGMYFGPVLLDFALAQGSNDRGVALQLGFRH